MCGIFGQVADRPETLDAWTTESAIAALRHRGPDGEGAWEDRSGSPGCKLAHTRLAIIDTSTGGRQPMVSRDGRHVVVFNGEIYNYRELRKELEGRGQRFDSDSDTEVLLAAFSVWGKACLGRLRGMFAFAVWDRRERSLTLARDRLGIKPLYLCRKPGSLAFSSELRALLKTGLAEARLSNRGVESFVAFGAVWGRQTLIEGVEELPPGTWAVFGKGEYREERFWQLPTQVDPQGPQTLDESIEAVGPTLKEAVRLQLRSDVKLGVFLSAGVDSSSLTALAKAELGEPPTTLTVSFPGAGSEGDSAKATADYLGTEHHDVHISLEKAARWVPEAVQSMDQPSVDGINTWIVAKAGREAGLRVALSGLGADEIFAGYEAFRRIPGLLRLPAWARPVGRLATRWSTGRPFGALPYTWRKAAWVLRDAGDPRWTYSVLRCLFTPEQVNALLPGHPGIDSFLSREPIGSDPVNALSLFELRHYLGETLLRDTDAMSMAHGLEVRPPFLDEALCEQVLKIPGDAKMSRAREQTDSSRMYRSASPGSSGGAGQDWIRTPLRFVARWSARRMACGGARCQRLTRGDRAGWLRGAVRCPEAKSGLGPLAPMAGAGRARSLAHGP